jgi:hypothetical protein
LLDKSCIFYWNKLIFLSVWINALALNFSFLLSDVASFACQDAFVVKPRPVTILRDLIERTKIAAREHDNAVARRFERMMVAVTGGEIDFAESTLSLNTADSATVGFISYMQTDLE